MARSYTKFCMISKAPYYGPTMISLVGKPGAAKLIKILFTFSVSEMTFRVANFLTSESIKSNSCPQMDDFNVKLTTQSHTLKISWLYSKPAKPTSIKKKRTSPDCLKIRRNCIENLDFSISIYILLLHSYFNVFTCCWYVSNMYHSRVNFRINSTYCIRSTPMYWSRLGWNCYGTDTYGPSSYST